MPIHSLWQSDTEKYSDFTWNEQTKTLQVKYDKPLFQKYKNHYISENAMFFRKEDGMWRFVGFVAKVSEHLDPKFVTLDIIKVKEYKYKFKSKNSAVTAFGFKSLYNKTVYPGGQGHRDGLIKLKVDSKSTFWKV